MKTRIKHRSPQHRGARPPAQADHDYQLELTNLMAANMDNIQDAVRKAHTPNEAGLWIVFRDATYDVKCIDESTLTTIADEFGAGMQFALTALACSLGTMIPTLAVYWPEQKPGWASAVTMISRF